MNTEQKIKVFHALGKYILAENQELEKAIHTASLHNKWFTPANVKHALKAIAENYLDEKLLHRWLSNYHLPGNKNPKRIAIIMAGNIPLAGFHDLLCALITGNIAIIKQSSKDRHLLPHLLDKLCEAEPQLKNTFGFAEQPLKNFDAVIATGSNNSSPYFEYYFGKYPHIIRRNRNSVAVLTGKETKDELLKLGDDIFLYFGLGCRSVSKLLVPLDFDFDKFFKSLEPFQSLIAHNGYKNNYDYNLTLLIMNKMPYYASDFLLLQENTSPSSPIATLNFEYYGNLNEMNGMLETCKDETQCVVAGNLKDSVAFGESQSPQLGDYADGVDTIRFLLENS